MFQLNFFTDTKIWASCNFHMRLNIILVLTPPPTQLKIWEQFLAGRLYRNRQWAGLGPSFGNPWTRGPRGQPPVPVNSRNQKIKFICGHSTLSVPRLKTSNRKDSVQLKTAQTVSWGYSKLFLPRHKPTPFFLELFFQASFLNGIPTANPELLNTKKKK